MRTARGLFRSFGTLFFPAVILCISVGVGSSCRKSRAEFRAERLETFLGSLPTEVREAFESIDVIEDCAAVGRLLHDARLLSPEVDARVDSIMRAELIPLFSDTEVVEFFWVYFDRALESGTVPEP